MSEFDIIDSEEGYRRGLVLGFTMAEVMLLILFVLLLVLAYAMFQKDESITKSKDQLRVATEENKNLTDKLDSIIALISRADEVDKEEIEEFFTELVRVKKENEKLKSKNQNLTKMENTLQKLKTKIALHNNKDVETLEEIEKQIDELIKQAEKAKDLEQCDVNRERLDELEEKNSLHQSKIDNLKGQLQHCTNLSQKKGHGPPPCWVTPNGKIEYIYDIYLKSDGLIIVDNKLPHRRIEQAELPLRGTVYNETISKDDFLHQAKPLFDWSIKNECRFYVKIIDATSATDKLIYKEYRKAVEGRFYIYNLE